MEPSVCCLPWRFVISPNTLLVYEVEVIDILPPKR